MPGLQPVGRPHLPEALLGDRLAIVVFRVRQTGGMPEPAPPAHDVIDRLGKQPAVATAPLAPALEDVLDAFVGVATLDKDLAQRAKGFVNDEVGQFQNGNRLG